MEHTASFPVLVLHNGACVIESTLHYNMSDVGLSEYYNSRKILPPQTLKMISWGRGIRQKLLKLAPCGLVSAVTSSRSRKVPRQPRTKTTSFHDERARRQNCTVVLCRYGTRAQQSWLIR